MFVKLNLPSFYVSAAVRCIRDFEPNLNNMYITQHYKKGTSMRKTKIIATIGPASSSPEMLKKLICAGVNTVRLNFSHGVHADHLKVIRCVRALSISLKQPVGILQDLQGPKIRLGTFKKGPVLLKKGARFTITTRACVGDEHIAGTTYTKLHKDVRPGNIVLINDGLVRLTVLAVRGRDVIMRVVVGGVVSNHKGINLPGVRVSEPSVTSKDRIDLAFGIRHNVDYVALSFVRTANDIRKVKAIVARSGKNIQVIAKIEKPEAVEQCHDIIDAADGIMVARGDLGVELSPEAVPAIQKKLIACAAKQNKIVITATQMLESMTEHPTPTRAEASDVANAVYDGTDAVMLSGETASGKYPMETVRMMHKIALAAEESHIGEKSGYFTDALDTPAIQAAANAALYICEEILGKAIIVFTMSGSTARLIAKNKRRETIIALTPDRDVLNQLSLVWGVVPLYLPYMRNSDDMIKKGLAAAQKSGLVNHGDKVVIVSGNAYHAGSTNMIKVATLR